MGRSWKSFEKEVAEFFGGKRVVRVSYGESAPDVMHPTLAIECKYGGQVPVKARSPFRFIRNGKPIIGFHANALKKEELSEVKPLKFICDGIDQCVGYEESAGKLPVLCLKAPRMRGFIAVCYEEDFDAVTLQAVQNKQDLEDTQSHQDHPRVVVVQYSTEHPQET